jgi:hypothetical protein
VSDIAADYTLCQEIRRISRGKGKGAAHHSEKRVSRRIALELHMRISSKDWTLVSAPTDYLNRDRQGESTNSSGPPSSKAAVNRSLSCEATLILACGGG